MRILLERYTTVECPEARHDFSDKTEITLNILDIDKLACYKEVKSQAISYTTGVPAYGRS